MIFTTGVVEPREGGLEAASKLYSARKLQKVGMPPELPRQEDGDRDQAFRGQRSQFLGHTWKGRDSTEPNVHMA